MGLEVFRKIIEESNYDSPYMPIDACIEDVKAFNAINSRFGEPFIIDVSK